MNKSLRATAFHEAGHTVAAYDQKIGTGVVTIVAKEDSLGSVLIRMPKWFQPDDPMGCEPRPGFDPWEEGAYSKTDNAARIRLWAERRIIVSLAGKHAERLVSPRHNHLGAASDYDNAQGLAEYVCGSAEEVKAYLGWLDVKARNTVTTPRNRVAIEAVAEALLEQRSLRPACVRRIIQASLLEACPQYQEAG